MVPNYANFDDEINTNEPAALELSCVINDVRHIIVCGHSDCKAINLLYQLQDAKLASKVSLRAKVYSINFSTNINLIVIIFFNKK